MWRFLKNAIVFIAELLLTLSLGYALFYGVVGYKALKKSQADPIFQQVLQTINHDQTAVEILGTPITPELLFFDHKTMDTFNRDTRQIDLVIPVQGPKQTATFFVRLIRKGAYWQYDLLLMNVDGYQEDIDLLLLNKPWYFYDERFKQLEAQ